MKYYIGVDLHRQFSQFAVLDEIGQTVGQFRAQNDKIELSDKLRIYPPQDTKVVVEASRGTLWFVDFLESLGYQWLVGHPLKIKAIASARIKNDKIDAKVLAHLLRTDLVPAAYIPPAPYREWRDIIRYRISLNHSRKRLKNKIHAVLIKYNVIHGFSNLFGKQGRLFLKNDLENRIPEYSRLIVLNYLALIENFDQKMKEAEQKIVAIAKDIPEAKLLTTIPGIKHFTALLILGEVGDVRRFPSPKKLCSYAGITPSVHQSANIQRYGSITKQGSSHLRWALIEAAQKISRYPKFKKLAYRLKIKKGWNTAKVAIARKLLTTIYYMLKYQQPYFPDGWTISDSKKNPLKNPSTVTVDSGQLHGCLYGQKPHTI